MHFKISCKSTNAEKKVLYIGWFIGENADDSASIPHMWRAADLRSAVCAYIHNQEVARGNRRELFLTAKAVRIIISWSTTTSVNSQYIGVFLNYRGRKKQKTTMEVDAGRRSSSPVSVNIQSRVNENFPAALADS